MNWREFHAAMPHLPDRPTKEQWLEAVAQAEALLLEVAESDRGMAGRVLGDTLMQAGAFLGFIEPESEGLAEDPVPRPLEQFQNELIAALQRLGDTPTLEAYAHEEVRLQEIAPPDADWEPLMQLRMNLIDKPPTTLDDFRAEQARELQRLGSSPTRTEIDAAVARLMALGPPPHASWEAFIQLREWVSSP